MGKTELNECIAFVQRAEELKNTLRSAHTSKGRQESTAEHSWRLCLFIMTFSKSFEGADVNKLLKMAVIHDLGEAVCGDIPATEQSDNNDKSTSERAGMDALCVGLPEDTQKEFMALWDEYEAATSLEAQIVKGFDKLETIMQHNQGINSPDIDYNFNLSYGQKYTSAVPLLEQIRQVLDNITREKCRTARNEGHAHECYTEQNP